MHTENSGRRAGILPGPTVSLCTFLHHFPLMHPFLNASLQTTSIGEVTAKTDLSKLECYKALLRKTPAAVRGIVRGENRRGGRKEHTEGNEKKKKKHRGICIIPNETPVRLTAWLAEYCFHNCGIIHHARSHKSPLPLSSSLFPTQTNTEQVQNMERLTRCTTVFHVSKTLSEFTILPSECQREGERQRQGGGGHPVEGGTNLKERERGMIGWFIQRVGESNFNGFWECKLFSLPPSIFPFSLRLSWCAPHLPSFTSVSLTPSLTPPPSWHTLFTGHSQRWAFPFSDRQICARCCIARKSRCSSCSVGQSKWQKD